MSNPDAGQNIETRLAEMKHSFFLLPLEERYMA
jgi:hypothetical protein